jgi:hypothetical protein
LTHQKVHLEWTLVTKRLQKRSSNNSYIIHKDL